MRARGKCPLPLSVGLALLLLVPCPSYGQQEVPQLIQVTLEPNKQALGPIFLRPHALTTVGFVLTNATDNNMNAIVVKLVDAGNDNQVLIQKEVEKIAAKDKVRVLFAAPKEKAKDKGKEKDPDKDTGERIEIVGAPTFKLQLWIETKGLEIKRDVDLIVREPRDYLKPTASYANETKKMGFSLSYLDNEQLTGPMQCPLELVLGPEFKQTKNGTHKNVLTGPKKNAELFSADLVFARDDTLEGRINLTVDGYERAFSYPVTLAGTGTPDLIPLGRIGARMVVPRYAKPNAKFPVPLELDGPLAGDYKVEVAIDRSGMKKDFVGVDYDGLRQQKVGVGYSPKGDLQFRADVRDWVTEFDTTGIFGNFWLRVCITKKGEPVEINFPKETRAHLAEQEPGPEPKTIKLYSLVITDDSVPEAIALVDLPKEWRLGKPLPVVAKVRLREKHQAPIDKVIFFRGKLPADGKIDPDSIIPGVVEFDEKKSEAKFKLPPQDEISSFDLSVQFVTKTGAVGTKTGLVKFKDFAGKGICTIKGTVAHGPLGQVGRNVILSDAGGAVKDVVETDGKGNYVFEKVPPGVYAVSSQMNYPALVGATKVVVPPGEELIEKVAVNLLAK